MHPARLTLWLVAAAGAAAVVQGQAAPAEVPLAQPAMHRAAVVVDLGDGQPPRTACVRFTEESISGIEALRRGGMDPVVRSFSGQGGAVCALCGKGCPADETCLTCGGGSYWAYHRAPAGSGGYRYSNTASSSTDVRDGDVEGWRWGSGAAPALLSVATVCGENTPTRPAPVATTAAPGTTVTTRESVVTTSTAIGATTTTTTTTTTTAMTTTSTTPQTQEEEVAQRPAAAPTVLRGEVRQQSRLWLLLPAGAVVVIGVVIWRARRRRAG